MSPQHVPGPLSEDGDATELSPAIRRAILRSEQTVGSRYEHPVRISVDDDLHAAAPSGLVDALFDTTLGLMHGWDGPLRVAAHEDGRWATIRLADSPLPPSGRAPAAIADEDLGRLRGVADLVGGTVDITSTPTSALDVLIRLPLDLRPPSSQLAAGPPDHQVVFYDHDDELVTDLVAFVEEGLALCQETVVVLTQTHLRGLMAALDVRGIDASALTVFDADATLATLTPGGPLDLDLVRSTVAAEIRQMAEANDGLRVYGEMVSLLWERGQHEDAIALEGLWNDVLDDVAFPLLCSYRTTQAHEDVAGLGFADVCAAHGAIIQPHAPSHR